MNDIESKVYQMMDWAGIEAIIYSEHDNPHDVLGTHETEDGTLVCAYCPKAVSATLTYKNKDVEMYMEDEGGFFATFVDAKKIKSHTFTFTLDGGKTETCGDPYAFAPYITSQDEELFSKGIHYDIYEKLGAHPMVIDGVEGTYFAVWAPNAMRVSVVGNFNQWDGRRYPMRRLVSSGIFELFIPGIKKGEIYKYEIKAKGGLTYLKADPYANAAELRPNTASIVTELDSFEWNDKKWIEDREKVDFKKTPMSIYEVHLGSWKKPKEENGSFYNYRELAVMLAAYVKKMGYTHIELMPVMEHPLDASWGYQVTGYYAVTSRYGTPEDFMFFMDYMHGEGIGVILDWVPAHFPRDTFGMSNFDGTCLYEHKDPRRGSHPHWGTLIYNYARPQVSNFLIANALFWAKKYHADGIRMDAVASMLYLDYGKKDGEWIPNVNGGNENYDAIELFHHLNSVFHKRAKGALLIAEESTAWPDVTKSVEEGGLGFDLKWNMGWMNDFIGYMEKDPLFRKGSHGALTFSMIYAYSENFILVLSHDEVVHGKSSMLYKMVGSENQKFSNLRLAYGFMQAHPGKKLLFMGNDFGQTNEWSEERSLSWELLQYESHNELQNFVADLNRFYKNNRAMYELDYERAGFQWISSLDADHSIVSFVRRSLSDGQTLFIICNFTPVVYKNYKTAVPLPGKYKEVLNSDAKKYGGSDVVNSRAKLARLEPVDGQPYSIQIDLCPLGIEIFEYDSPAFMKDDKANSKVIVQKKSDSDDGKDDHRQQDDLKEKKVNMKKEAKPVKAVKTAKTVKTEAAGKVKVKAVKTAKTVKTEAAGKVQAKAAKTAKAVKDIKTETKANTDAKPVKAEKLSKTAKNKSSEGKITRK